MVDTQLKKGVLELCVLSVLKDKDCYGYELVTEICKNIEISDGTIYPILRRLTKEGYFNTYLKESTEGPPRKYYNLTQQGEQKRVELTEEWYGFVDAVNELIKNNEEKIITKGDEHNE